MKKKKYSQLRKEIKNLNIAEGAVLLAGGAAFIATFLYLKSQGLENYSALEQYLALLPSVLSLPISAEIFTKIKDKVEDKQHKLYFDNQSKKEDYLKAYYKNLYKKTLTEKEAEALFAFPEYIHASLYKNITWLSNYEFAFQKRKPIGVSPVTKFPNEDINDDSFVYLKEKMVADSMIQDNIKIMKEQFEIGCPYLEFKLIVPRNDLSGKKLKKVSFGFTNINQVCEFEKEIKKIHNEAQKIINSKKYQKRLDKEKKQNQASSNQEINM